MGAMVAADCLAFAGSAAVLLLGLLAALARTTGETGLPPPKGGAQLAVTGRMVGAPLGWSAPFHRAGPQPQALAPASYCSARDRTARRPAAHRGSCLLGSALRLRRAASDKR